MYAPPDVFIALLARDVRTKCYSQLNVHTALMKQLLLHTERTGLHGLRSMSNLDQGGLSGPPCRTPVIILSLLGS